MSMTEKDMADIKARWDDLERRAIASLSPELQAVVLQGKTDIKALLAEVYARQWGAPERIGPRQWRWPSQEEPKP